VLSPAKPCSPTILQLRTKPAQSRALESRGQTENVRPQNRPVPVQRYAPKPLALLGFSALPGREEKVVLGRVGGGRETGIEPSPPERPPSALVVAAVLRRDLSEGQCDPRPRKLSSSAVFSSEGSSARLRAGERRRDQPSSRIPWRDPCQTAGSSWSPPSAEGQDHLPKDRRMAAEGPVYGLRSLRHCAVRSWTAGRGRGGNPVPEVRCLVSSTSEPAPR
jgi:hypothetical protein